MTIRFLHTTPSDRPEFPFQAGQMIVVTKLTAEMRAWLKDGRAELVKDEPERAIGRDPERAIHV